MMTEMQVTVAIAAFGFVMGCWCLGAGMEAMGHKISYGLSMLAEEILRARAKEERRGLE